MAWNQTFKIKGYWISFHSTHSVDIQLNLSYVTEWKKKQQFSMLFTYLAHQNSIYTNPSNTIKQKTLQQSITIHPSISIYRTNKKFIVPWHHISSAKLIQIAFHHSRWCLFCINTFTEKHTFCATNLFQLNARCYSRIIFNNVFVQWLTLFFFA